MSYDSLYIGVFTIDCKSTIFTDEIKTYINPPKEFEHYILWGVYDLYPSMDSYRPPIFSGCVFNKKDILNIAKRFGLENDFSIDNTKYINKRFSESFIHKENSNLICYAKKAKGFNILVWKTSLHYILDIPPIRNDLLTEEEIKQILLENMMYYVNKYAESWKIPIEKAIESHKQSINRDFTKELNGFFYKNYIRKKEAKAKLDKINNASDDLFFVDFLYTQGHVIKNKRLWLRHRIIKTTKDYIYVEKFPYYGGSYLPQSWQNFIIYTCRISVKEINKNGMCYSRAIHKFFYQKEKLKNDLIDDHIKGFIKSNFFNGFDDLNQIFVMPEKDVDWALQVLEIKSKKYSEKDIKKAFVVASFKHHPDKGGDAKEFIKCTAARDFLMDLLNNEIVQS